VAKRITGCIAQAELAARIGGDEFAIIHRCGNPQSNEQLARRLNAALSHPFALTADTVTIGASVGIKIWRNDHTIDSLLQSADAALYAAKHAGRGGWRNYEDCSACHVDAKAV
jgi:diguanylate cyclase (GGDEF)-like protein